MTRITNWLLTCGMADVDAALLTLDAPGPNRRTDARLVVPGGQSIVFCVEAGDRLTVVDTEGFQPAEIFTLPGEAFPLSGEPVTLSHALTTVQNSHDARAAIAANRAGWDSIFGTKLFAGESAAGASVETMARESALCLIFAPGAPMAPDEQAAPTEIHVTISSSRSEKGPVPGPLAPPKLEMRVAGATARAYRVAAGDYIQITDVDGKQCSDFLAFDAAALANGSEYGLDPTATRTLTGAKHPQPGLHGKFFDARMVPLVEVVRDTVGRHDTFMMACAAKYYDDLGYPGHANCTDNFNHALAPFGVAPRAGWPAINFFYNTIVSDSGGAIALDEPWSRPGDYVLLRALTDLVCASSSCADDVDAANGWEPTDIHLRVYDRAANFSRGIAHRMTKDAEPKLTRSSGFHSRTSILTRNFIDYRGFWMAGCYHNQGPITEYWACRERASLMDLSALRKFEVTGPDAEALMQLAVTRDMRKLAIGQIVYTAMCYPHGGMLDDGTVFRLGQNNFRWICGDDYCGVWLRELAATHGLKAWVKSSTDQLHNLALQGPLSRDILSEIIVTPPDRPSITELGWFRFTVGRVGNTQGPAVLVSRTGYTGELGFEIWCHPDQAPAVWDALWEAGVKHGMLPMGLDALDMLRIESGLIFAGYDFCDQTDPFEAGIGFAVPDTKPDMFIGKEALARRRGAPHRKLVGLDIEGNDPVAHGDPVYAGRARIGVITSATRSPILGKIIALARLDIGAAAAGSAVEIGRLDGQQKRIRAAVTGFPHFDPKKTRVRAAAPPASQPSNMAPSA